MSDPGGCACPELAAVTTAMGAGRCGPWCAYVRVGRSGGDGKRLVVLFGNLWGHGLLMAVVPLIARVTCKERQTATA